MSILADFYNLDLDTSGITKGRWKFPEDDRSKIMTFFEKHAPAVLKYQTAEDIDVLPRPADGFEILGTLGMYEHDNQKSWFDSESSNEFYMDYFILRDVIETYLLERQITKGRWAWIRGIGRCLSPTVLVGNNETREVFSLGNFPDENVDLDHYTVLKGHSAHEKWELGVNRLIVTLYNELIDFLNGEFQLRRCAADNCHKIFQPAPQGSEQKYCSARCRNRMWARKNR